MKKALCIGIDSYERINQLTQCVKDAKAMKSVLEHNSDGSQNFQTTLICTSAEHPSVTTIEIRIAIANLFQNEPETALLYFSGHGYCDAQGGYICSSESFLTKESDRIVPNQIISLNEIMKIISETKAHNKIIILDSCHAGMAGSIGAIPHFSILPENTTIIAACDTDQVACEGVFTPLLIEALEGGAMSITGDVTPGSIYSYIDRSLGWWGQRPVFKANIKNFVPIRHNIPSISITKLRRMTEIFKSCDIEYALDPTYESDKHEVENKTVNKEHEAIFDLLQDYVKLNLVVPVGEKHMYYAAIRYKSCKLTALGQHYWKLIKTEKI